MPSYKLTLTRNNAANSIPPLKPGEMAERPSDLPAESVIYSQVFDDLEFDVKELIHSLNKPVRRRKQKAAKT